MLVVSGWVGNFSFINEDKYALVGSFPHPIHVLDISFPAKRWFFIAVLG